jgi:ABC-2 type transport system permease protein
VIEAVRLQPSRARLFMGEAMKLPAFVRRDFLVAWSYRMSFFSDIVSLAGMALTFYFIGLMVDPAKLPTYGGTQVTYLEFAAIGITLSVFIHFALDRVAHAMRGEQMMGTLESVLMTPTARSTVQLGSVVFDLIYIPLRTAIFLIVVSLSFGLSFELSGIPMALVILFFFIPFVWGLGVVSAAAILTFRRGSGMIGMAAVGLALISGIYFPIDLLPGWLAGISRLNPIALAVEGMRDSLLGGAGWLDVAPTVLVLAPLSALSLLLGIFAFRLAVRRERRAGTLGLY